MKKIFVIFICAMFLFISSALAVPLSEYDTDDNPSGQDPLLGPWTHEIGVGFPIEELISASWEETTYTPCPRDYQGGQNIEVTITNLTDLSFEEVTYVSDPETSITNDDLTLINGQEAFLIDYLGINTPLVYESMNVDGIFEAGETWKFVIQEYSNSLSLVASALGSYDSVNNLGLIGNQSGGDIISSGSIIVTPEPMTISLLAMGAIALLRRRK
ncbi:MAG: PEP-CTERM sorting domain-containing protein [Phycisphaerae bacterium]|jgi:hypothetical protein